MSKSIHWIIPTTTALVTTIPCYAVQYLTVQEAQKACFPKGGDFKPVSFKISDAQLKEIEDAVDQPSFEGTKAWKVSRDGEFAGWFLVDQVIGKHENITYAVALDPDGKVKSVEVMEYRESYGYQIRDADWRMQFVGKASDSKLKLNYDIKNISGATLSCRHVTEGIKKLLNLHDVVLKKS